MCCSTIDWRKFYDPDLDEYLVSIRMSGDILINNIFTGPPNGQSSWENRLFGLATFVLRGLHGRYNVIPVIAVANSIGGT